MTGFNFFCCEIELRVRLSRRFKARNNILKVIYRMYSYLKLTVYICSLDWPNYVSGTTFNLHKLSIFWISLTTRTLQTKRNPRKGIVPHSSGLESMLFSVGIILL